MAPTGHHCRAGTPSVGSNETFRQVTESRENALALEIPGDLPSSHGSGTGRT